MLGEKQSEGMKYDIIAAGHRRGELVQEIQETARHINTRFPKNMQTTLPRKVPPLPPSQLFH